ncbi:penicillin-binding transpeptidase domain-containing protein, partial [Georgenia sp. 10Sc9-8]|nr:penicillin-binding transpeptidase domain-containing protein [Georgenia halotolerans]
IFTLIEWLRDGNALYDVVDGDKESYPRDTWEISCAPEWAADYEANNLEGFGADEMPVIDATRMSVNLAYVEMANQLDLCDIRDVATRMGARTGGGEPLTPNPAMVLGTNLLTPLSMANVVATLSAQGVRCDPVAITEATTRDGETIDVPPANCTRVLEEDIAAGATHALEAVVGDNPYEDTGYFADIPGRDVAGKTGTTNQHANAWFVGYTPELAAAVWVGHQ